MKPNRRKLKLDRQSIRTLNPEALRRVGGGTELPSVHWCDTGTWWCPDQTDTCWCLPTW